MNRTFLLRVLGWSVVANFAATAVVAQTTKVENAVQSTAGGTAQSTSFGVIATIGQTSPPGEASAGQFKLSSGFISTLGNAPPTVTNAIANQTLTLGSAAFTRDLNASPAVFNDPNGDALTYTAISSSNAIATAGVSGSTLTVTAVAVGNATITVTADDKNGGTVVTTFSVTVTTAANRPPMLTNAILNQTFAPGATFARDLNAPPPVFNDPDGDPLTHTASSSNILVAAVDISGSTLSILSIVAISPGAVTITVAANDNKGGMASTTFTVTVSQAANRAPTVINIISNVTLPIGGPSFIRDLNVAPPVFTDPDGDPLNYTPSSSATNIATASISGSRLTVAPVAAGTATITITANDGRGGSAPTSFGVTVTTTSNQPPSITHTASSTPRPENQAISLQATIADDGGIASVFLKYRQGGAATPFDSTAMTRVGTSSSFEGMIPANKTTGGLGVEYFIKAVDNGNPPLTTFSPSTGVFALSIQVSKITNLRDQPAAGAQLDRTAYRLISVPLLLDNNPSAVSILQAKFGVYDNTKWRLYGIDPARRQNTNDKNAYVEITSGGDLSPGRSLFLIVKEANQRLEAGPGRTNKTDGEFSITLDPGHNFVATPFNFTIPADKLRLSNNEPIVLWSYTGGSAFERTNVLKEWEGHYIANNNPTAVTLSVNPNLGVAPRKMREKPETSGWRMQIAASCGRVRDFENFAGVDAASVDRWDYNDVVEPPPFGDFVSLYFEHPEWEKVFHRYTDDIRSATSTNHQWPFRVDTNIPNEIVTLRFEGIASLAPDLSVFLVDAELNYKQNLRENAVYRYQPRRLERASEFTLIVGKEDFVSAQTAGAQGVPENFVLEQNFPNPFGVGGAYLLESEARTMIRFGLPAPSVVTIKVFDLAGREVATLLEKAELPPGRHQRMWNGRDASGRLVPNGIYFYRLAAGSVVRTMKMMVVR